MMRMRESARLVGLGLVLLLAAGGIATGDARAPGGGPEVEWVYGYGGWQTEEHPHAAVQVRDGGFVIVGEATGAAGSRIFVVRTDERGTQLLARSYGAGRFNLGNFVLEEADGSFLVAGSWDVGAGAVREDRVLLRLAGRRRSAGPCGPIRRRGGTPSRGSRSNADGTIVAVGYRAAAQDELSSFLVDTGRGFVMKLHRDLSVAWERNLPAALFQAFRVQPRTDAPGYAVFGACRGRGERTQFCISLVDEEGNAAPPITYGAGTSHPYDFDAAHGGGFILTGHLATCPDGCWDGWLVRVDAAGREVWNVSFGEPNGGAPERMYEECYGVRAVPGGGYVTACGSGVEPGNEARPDDPLNTWRAYVVRVTEAGTIRWQASYGSPHANNAAEFVLPTRDGGFAVFADSDEHGPGEGASFALYKLAGDPSR